MKILLTFLAIAIWILPLPGEYIAQAQDEDEISLDEDSEFDEEDDSDFDDEDDSGDDEDFEELGDDEDEDDDLFAEFEEEEDEEEEPLSAEDDGEEAGEDELVAEEFEEDPALESQPEEEAEEIAEEEAFEEPAEEEVPVEESVVAEEIPEAPVEETVLAEPVNEGPDEAFEARLNEIFENYNRAPVTPEEWTQLAGEKETEIYDVQLGDTLWGISEMLFGDGNYWPKIWSFNKFITNPHLIEVGDQIKFMAGDTENAPQVLVESAEDLPMQTELEEEYEEDPSQPEIPPPSRTYRPALNVLPPSLPDDPPKYSPEFDESGFAVSGRSFSRSESATVTLSSYFTEDYPDEVGEVREVLGGRQSAGLYENVYVEMDNGSPGDVFTIVADEGETVGGAEIDVRAGQSVEYQGEIELKEVVAEGRNLFRALVVTSVNPITVGGQVIPGRIPRVEVSQDGRESTAKARIVGGEFDEDRGVLGVGATVYLDAGSAEGLETGDIVGVVANEELRNDSTLIELNNRQIGKVKIVKVEAEVATGIVVYANSSISTGDFVGQVVISRLQEGSEESIEEDTSDDFAEEDDFEDSEEEEGGGPEDFSEGEDDFPGEDFDEGEEGGDEDFEEDDIEEGELEE